MKIAVTGSNGQLGFELLRQAQVLDLNCVGWSRQDLDISDQAQVLNLVKATSPDIVINAAAYTAVDRAESEPELAYAVNRDGVANLGVACREAGIPLIHISTDYVFDGQQSRPYMENDPVNPSGVYGAGKLAGEKALREECEQHIIIRTAWVYGAHGHNFVKTMLRLGREKENLSVVADQYGCPTSALDIAETVLNISQQVFDKGKRKWGTYHYVAKGVTTWHEFAAAIIDEARQYELLRVRNIKPITTSEYPTPARRPSNSALNCTKIKQAFTIHCKPWRQSLREVIKELYT